MKITIAKCLLICISITSSLFAQENENIHNKKPNTLLEFSQIEKYYNEASKGSNFVPDIDIYTKTYGYLLVAEYSGSKREISEEKLNYLNTLFKAMQFPHKASEIFNHEILVKLSSKKYWLPIQTSLIEFWDEELKAGNKALIYIRAYGSKKGKEEDKWLFTINSFNSDYYNGLWNIALEGFNNGDPSNGIRCTKKMMELDPSDGRNYSLYGSYFYKEAYPDNKRLLMKADSLYHLAEKLSPNYGYGHYQRALVKFLLGDYEKAWQAIDQAKSLGVTNMDNSFLEDLENKLSYSTYLKKTKR